MLERIGAGRGCPRSTTPCCAAQQRRAVATRSASTRARLRRPVHHPLPRAPASRRAATSRPHTASWCPLARRTIRCLRRRYRSLEAPHPKQRWRHRAARRARAAPLQRRRGAERAPPRRHEDPVYFTNGDADELYFIQQGGGLLRSPFGDLSLQHARLRLRAEGHAAPLPARGRASPQYWLWIECRGGVSLPEQYRNDVGPALAWMAPYSHRDFRAPELPRPARRGPARARGAQAQGVSRLRAPQDSPLDVVGWDGTVYPFAFPDPELSAARGPGPPAAHRARELRRRAAS